MSDEKGNRQRTQAEGVAAETDWRPAAGIPRRACRDLWTPAERAIQDAVDVVEAAGASPLLTEAVVLLGRARDRVADHVDGLAASGPTGSPAVEGDRRG